MLTLKVTTTLKLSDAETCNTDNEILIFAHRHDFRADLISMICV